MKKLIIALSIIAASPCLATPADCGLIVSKMAQAIPSEMNKAAATPSLLKSCNAGVSMKLNGVDIEMAMRVAGTDDPIVATKGYPYAYAYAIGTVAMLRGYAETK